MVDGSYTEEILNIASTTNVCVLGRLMFDLDCNRIEPTVQCRKTTTLKLLSHYFNAVKYVKIKSPVSVKS